MKGFVMDKPRPNFILALMLAILGILISLQVRAILDESKNDISSQDRYVQLQEALKVERKNIEDYQALLKQKEKIIKSYEKSAGRKDSNIEQMRLDLERYKAIAGLTDVNGPGVIITLDDANVRENEYIDENETIIHDFDILELLNELKAGGAEAISVNDERITSNSEQICAGPTIRINNTKYATPFIIKAIGSKNDLKVQLESPHSIVNVLAIRGIKVDVKYADAIRINGYRGSTYTLMGREANQ